MRSSELVHRESWHGEKEVRGVSVWENRCPEQSKPELTMSELEPEGFPLCLQSTLKLMKLLKKTVFVASEQIPP